MNRIALLVAIAAVLSGCQSTQPGSQNHSSLYSGENNLLYRVQEEADSPEQAMLIAETAYRAGNLDQALFQYLRAADLDPKRLDALVWAGRIHRERGNYPLAEVAFNEVLSKDPDNLDALTEMGMLYLAMRRHDNAGEMLGKAARLDQKRVGGPYVDMQSADPGTLKVDSRSPIKVYNGLGVLSDLRNDFPRSEGFYRLAMQIEPRSALVQNSIGYSYYLAGNWAEAEMAYKRGLTYDSRYQPLWRNYGLLLARRGAFEEALASFRQVEGDAEASNDVGYICLIEGNLDMAESLFRSALEQSPAHYESAWQNLNRVQQIRRIRQMDRPSPDVASTVDVTAVAGQ